MSNLWQQASGLVGKTLPLTARSGTFEIVRTDGDYLFIVPESTGKERRLYRRSFEMAEEQGLNTRSVTPSELSKAEVTGRNSSYIAAIIQHLHGSQ